MIEEDPEVRWVEALCYSYDASEQAAKNIESWKDLDIIPVRLKVKRVLNVA